MYMFWLFFPPLFPSHPYQTLLLNIMNLLYDLNLVCFVLSIISVCAIFFYTFTFSQNVSLKKMSVL